MLQLDTYKTQIVKKIPFEKLVSNGFLEIIYMKNQLPINFGTALVSYKKLRYNKT